MSWINKQKYVCPVVVSALWRVDDTARCLDLSSQMAGWLLYSGPYSYIEARYKSDANRFMCRSEIERNAATEEDRRPWQDPPGAGFRPRPCAQAIDESRPGAGPRRRGPTRRRRSARWPGLGYPPAGRRRGQSGATTSYAPRYPSRDHAIAGRGAAKRTPWEREAVMPGKYRGVPAAALPPAFRARVRSASGSGASGAACASANHACAGRPLTHLQRGPSPASIRPRRW